jgi:hypothetical protein
MTATTIERNTDGLLSSGVPAFKNFGVKGGEKILYGTIVMATTTGYAAEAFTTDEGIGAVGVALATVDNLTGSDGDKTVDVGMGVYYFFNSAGEDAITAGDFGSVCFIVDNQTVAKTSADGARSRAGIVWDINPSGQVGVLFGQNTRGSN